jgi:hypothetical protein
VKWEIEIFKWESEPYRAQADELWQVLSHVVGIPDEISHFEVFQIGMPEEQPS